MFFQYSLRLSAFAENQGKISRKDAGGAKKSVIFCNFELK
jgi:hypothetical protein